MLIDGEVYRCLCKVVIVLYEGGFIFIVRFKILGKVSDLGLLLSNIRR